VIGFIEKEGIRELITKYPQAARSYAAIMAVKIAIREFSKEYFSILGNRCQISGG
jgi:hypothetical protein